MCMKKVWRQALQRWANGLAKWQPRRLVLMAPLSISNLLPCELHINLNHAQQEDHFDLRRSSSAGDLRSPTKTRKKSRHGVHTAAITLSKGERRRVHSANADFPLEIELWVDGESNEDSRLSGSFSFHCPHPGQQLSKWCMICPSNDWSSARSVVLRLDISAAADGTCSLSIGTTNWLYNASSIGIRLYDARDLNNHVLQCEGKTAGAQMFSLDTRFKRSLPTHNAVETISGQVPFSKARVGGILETGANSKHERWPDQGKLLSQTFSIEAVGTDGVLEVLCAPA